MFLFLSINLFNKITYIAFSLWDGMGCVGGKVQPILEDIAEDVNEKVEDTSDITLHPKRVDGSVFEPISLDWSVLDTKDDVTVQRAAFFGILSAEAYYGHALDTSIFCKANSFDSLKMMVEGEAACMIITKDKHVVVSFRGTNSISDAIDDLNIVGKTLKEFPEIGMIHRGFANYLFRLEAQVVAFLKDITTPQSMIWFTGHSLGAAAAQIMCAVWKQKELVAGIYTFGSPRVGGMKWHKYMNKTFKNKIFRVLNYRDTVASMPGLWLGYLHGMFVYAVVLIRVIVISTCCISFGTFVEYCINLLPCISA